MNVSTVLITTVLKLKMKYVITWLVHLHVSACKALI